MQLLVTMLPSSSCSSIRFPSWGAIRSVNNSKNLQPNIVWTSQYQLHAGVVDSIMPSKSRQEHKIKPLVQVKLAGKKYRFVRCKSPYMEHILYFRYLGWKFDYYFSRYKLGPSLHVSSPIFQYFQTPLSFILLYSMSMQVPSSLLNQRTLVATLIVLPLFEKVEQHNK